MFNSIRRNTALFILVVFATTALFGFSMFVELQPAKAIFGIDAAIRFAIDVATAFARAFLLRLIARFAMELLQKLEQHHTIQNILYYADALEVDQYLGNYVNKQIDKPKGESDVKKDPALTNVDAIIAKDNQNNFYERNRGQIDLIASLSQQRADIDFYADRAEISGGSSANLSWQVDSSALNIRVELQTQGGGTQSVDAVGSVTVSPGQTTDYYLAVFDAATNNLMQTEHVRITVTGTAEPVLAPNPIKAIPGFTRDEERQLTTAAVLRLTNGGSCVGGPDAAIRNVAIYNAAKIRGFSFNQLQPSDPSAIYYQRMAMMGNPYASPDFQELAMRDFASQAQSVAKQAAIQEITSPGLKNVRSGSNLIVKGVASIQSRVDKLLDKIFKQQDINSDSNAIAGVANVIGTILGTVIADVVFSNILGARVLAENPYCGLPSPTIARNLATPNYNADTTGQKTNIINNSAPSAAESAQPFIRVNGEITTSIREGEGVTLSWSVGNIPGQASISAGIGAVGASGSLGLTPTTDTAYALTVGGNTIGVAYVTVLPAPVTGLPEEEVGGAQIELSPSFKVRE